MIIMSHIYEHVSLILINLFKKLVYFFYREGP
jgi:hypothetical protein